MKTLSKLFDRIWYDQKKYYWPVIFLLLPLSLAFFIVTFIRKQLLIKKQSHLPVPIIVVGNISVGGTGKTPLLCALAQAFTKRGKRVGIVSRGYGGNFAECTRLVSVNDDAISVGDEPLLIARTTECPVVVGRDRVAAAKHLLSAHKVEVILSDDGLQHYALPRDVEIVVVDAQRGVGNGFFLPAGPLREPASRLQSVDFVVVNGLANSSNALPNAKNILSVNLTPQHWVAVASGNIFPLEFLAKNTVVHAVAGIGNPSKFFSTLTSIGFSVIEHAFSDHHIFSERDFQFDDNLPVLMTEKDAVKCMGFAKESWYALRVAMSLSDEWVDTVWHKASQVHSNYVG